MKSSSTPCANSAGQNEPSTVSMTSRSSTSKPARDLTLERIHPSAAFFAKSGTGTALPATKPSTSSSMSWFRELNGESRTIPATLGSLFAYRRAVTAPMDWPQRPTRPTRPVDLRCATTAATSRTSRAPNATCSPSLRPLPLKSKAKTVTPEGRRRRATSTASQRLPLLPWR